MQCKRAFLPVKVFVLSTTSKSCGTLQVSVSSGCGASELNDGHSSHENDDEAEEQECACATGDAATGCVS